MIKAASILQDFSHLFFPHTCAGCGTDSIGAQALLCVHCVEQLPLTNFHLYAGNPVEKYFWGRMPLNAAASWCHFTEGSLVQHLLHQLKYKGYRDLGYLLGRMMARSLKASGRFTEIDILLPLPLFASRLKKRGYNQSEVLCVGMAEVLNVPVVNNAVIRTAATETQTRKNRLDRWTNMEGKFSLLQSTDLCGKHVLLVDDVLTTGATLEACGETILAAGPAKLSIATLAYTV